MPSFTKANTCLLFLVMSSFIITLTITTTVVVAASSAIIVGGGKNDLDLVRKIKNSKKMNANANANEDTICTMQDFLGTSQYSNCKGEETNVTIACDTTDDAATTTTKKICTYSEHPVQYNDTAAAAATAVECGDHGSFDPETHLTRDHATGVCSLKFLRLTSTCVGAPARSGFGVMVEVPPRTGPGTSPGSHNHHKHNEDKNHKNNSGLLLWFSYDAGATIYNNKDPRLTVPLERSSTRRMQFWWAIDLLFSSSSDDSEDEVDNACLPATGTFDGVSTVSQGKWDPFQTCFKDTTDSSIPGSYCWTNSYYCAGQHSPCVPNGYVLIGYGDGWKFVENDDTPSLCGTPCQAQHQHVFVAIPSF